MQRRPQRRPSRRRATPSRELCRAPRHLGQALRRQVRPGRDLRARASARSRASSASSTRATATSTSPSGIRQIGYSTISERLARDVQHLLLRLGIIVEDPHAEAGGLRGHRRRSRARGPDHRTRRSIGAFCELVDGRRQDRPQAGARSRGLKERNGTNADTIPVAVWDQVLAVKGDRSVGRGQRGVRPSAQPQLARGHARPLTRAASDALADGARRRAARSTSRPRTCGGTRSSRSSRSARRRPTTSTVPVHHNFVADDIVVHNSALVCNIAENAAIEHNAPVALFSLEMSETELAQRFVASQARIKGEELRKGRVAEHKWPKILEAQPAARARAAVHRRLVRRRHARDPREGAPAAPAARRSG